jgi:hypothetical protein
MTDGWVGFRISPKKDSSRSKSSLEFELRSDLLIAKVLKFLTTQEGVESWLVSFSKFKAQLGAKLRFSIGEENYGGTYARIDIPKRVILLTELHGEIDFRLIEKSDGTEISLRFTKNLTESEKSDWETLVKDCFARFSQVLTSGN